eukprot:5294334-Amphidinium_carterae.1
MRTNPKGAAGKTCSDNSGVRNDARHLSLQTECVRDALKYPRSGPPRDLVQGILWLEDFFNRITGAEGSHGIRVRHLTHKAFDHEKLEGLLRELIVKLRMRRSYARVDSALGVTSQPSNRPGARSLEADANEARTPQKKKATTPPKKKL